MNKPTRFDANSPEARDIAHHLHPYTNPGLLKETGPQIINSGDGIYVTDNDGKTFIEGMSGLWCASLGFGEKELVDAAVNQLRKLPFYHSFTGKTVNPAIDLAEALIRIAPEGLDKVFFCNSGSEANDTAIKMVWYYHAAMGKPEKKKVISRKRGYHGVTIAAASLTALAYAQDGFGLPLDFALHTSSPHYFQDARDGESELEFSRRLGEELEAMIMAEGADHIGAFIAEPLMGAGGVIMPPQGYFDVIQPILKKHDILLIADEVICGFGRTGNMWGSETFGLAPDILTCAKALSSAYLPISAVMVSGQVAQGVEEQANRLGQFGHGYTYSAHPVPAAVALRTMELMEERQIIPHVREVAPHFAERVARLGRFNCVGHTRAIGLIGAMEFVAQPQSRIKHDPAVKFAAQVMKLAHEEGVILRALPCDAIGFCPPLIITPQQIDDMFDRIEAMMPKADALSRELA
ncbi:MAG: aminotransferase class III-fold pyridoxal phosphate-dependent enzyme [Alphaproteobacteria bacterium]|nr:aminotransferase class III-fold pyridoxal phosphate-dependent enzyme [Alphaproteobacteria bacterium]